VSLTLTLGPRGEQLLEAHLRTGRYHSPEEVVTRALESLAENESQAIERKKTTAEAIAHIRQSRKGITLGGLKIKDLIHEGHKY
jgi:Arc/MetJ-type ribon-helix-helix transcriptional regulator